MTMSCPRFFSVDVTIEIKNVYYICLFNNLATIVVIRQATIQLAEIMNYFDLQA